MTWKRDRTGGICIHKSPQEQQPSRFEWLNIDLDGKRAGKLRVSRGEREIIIYSIQIFPEYQNIGLARNVIQRLQADYERVIADRVRKEAVGFWLKLGFRKTPQQQYMYTRSANEQTTE